MNRYQFLTRVRNRYQILTSVKIGIKSSHVKNGIKTHTCDELVLILTHVKNWYQIITHIKNWYLIATYVSDKTVKNWNRMRNAADLGGILFMLGIRMYAI